MIRHTLSRISSKIHLDRLALASLVLVAFAWTYSLISPVIGSPSCSDRYAKLVARASAGDAALLYDSCLSQSYRARGSQESFILVYGAERPVSEYKKVGSYTRADGYTYNFYAVYNDERAAWYVITTDAQGLVVGIE